jgi:hypothetical protein
LGAEIQFYILAPLLFLATPRKYFLVFLISFIIFLLAQLNLINADYYGYRLLPGVLFVFLLGASLRNGSAQTKQYLVFAWLLSLLYAAHLLIDGIELPYVREVALGLALGMPIIFFQFKTSALPHFNGLVKLDRKLGAWSYGIFLFHFPVMQLSQLITGSHRFLFIISLSLFLAVLGHHYIEKPIWKKFR